MLYISYGSVCKLETQILLTGDLDLIEKGVLGTLKKDIAESQRMLKALIKSLENKPLTPGILGPSSPNKLEKILQYYYKRHVISGGLRKGSL